MEKSRTNMVLSKNTRKDLDLLKVKKDFKTFEELFIYLLEIEKKYTENNFEKKK